jgi:glutathione S-transferase
MILSPRRHDDSVIKLHQFPRVWGRNISPFTLKLETWLILAGVPFEVVEVINPWRGPKGKLPFIDDGGRRIGDSQMIIEHLGRSRGIDLDDGLDRLARADALAFRRLLEEHLYFIGVYSRWIDPEGWQVVKPAMFARLPPGLRQTLPEIARRKVRRDLVGQGTLRHSRDEIYALGRADLEAVAAFLDEGPFFFRDRPTTLDAVAYGMLANILMVPVETSLKRIALGLPNLLAFCETMEQHIAARREATAEDEPHAGP